MAGIQINKRKPLWMLLASAFPRRKWDQSKFTENSERFLVMEMGKELGIKENEFDCWEKVSNKDIVRVGGSSILSKHGNSISKLLVATFPEHKWDLSRFPVKPRRYRFGSESQIEFMNKIGEKLGIKEGDYEAWYRVKFSEIVGHGGNFLLHRKGRTLYSLFSSIFPEHKWDQSKFHHKPPDYWASKENQRAFMLELGQTLGIKEGDMEPWYHVTRTEVGKHGGYALLDLYENSQRILLTSLFPDHRWLPWKFHMKQRLWASSDPDTLLALVKHVEEALSFQKKEDWYRLSREHLQKLELVGWLNSRREVMRLLSSVYPEHSWDPAQFAIASSTST